MDEIIWHHDFNGLNFHSSLGEKFILIVGPSGVGKSTLADYLEKNLIYSKIIPNCTTRAKRFDENESHFKYMSSMEFNKHAKNKCFFLYRANLNPKYGYLKDDLNSILNKNEYVIFMFRNSGLNYLMNFVKNFFTIIIESKSLDIVEHSKDANHQTIKITNEILIENKNLFKKLIERGYRVKTIQNDYSHNFFSRIDEIVNCM